MENVNKNDISVKKLPKYHGKKVLKVLNIIIPDKGEAQYNCVMDDGSKELVPAKFFKK